MSEFLVLIAAEEKRALSPEDEQKCLMSYGEWAQSLGNKHLSGKRLDLSEGQLLPSKSKLTTDGPFVEAKELIAGIILLEADSIQEAVRMAETCPLRDYFQLYVKPTLD
ncbi:MAG: YciI family protein [Cyclobacteriaceae bacterium]